MMAVPGVALFVHTDGDFDDEQLYIGFAKNAEACSDDVSGDYTFIHIGLGLNENFSMYRTDDNFVNILHSDFGFDSTASTATPEVIYRTGSENTVLTDSGCSNGVRTRSTGSSEIFGIGMVYNYRTTTDINPATGNPFPENNLYNTGNIILFGR